MILTGWALIGSQRIQNGGNFAEGQSRCSTTVVDHRGVNIDIVALGPVGRDT